MIRGIAKRHGFIPNEVFLVAKSALGPHGANPPHFYNFSIGTRVGLGVNGPHKAAGHLQNTPRTCIPLGAAGS